MNMDIASEVLTLNEFVDLLEERFDVRFTTAICQRWCQQGLIAGAVNKSTGANNRRGLWLVPAAAARAFVPPSIARKDSAK